MTVVDVMNNLVFVDCEASGPCPGKGELTEFGAVVWRTRETFHGVLIEGRPRVEKPELSEIVGQRHDAHAVFRAFERWLLAVCTERPIFVSDNPAFDWQWINHGFHHMLDHNPFGHSARRISDFYAGLMGTSHRRWAGSGCG